MKGQTKLGFDNYAIRALHWKAEQLLEYAASLRLDTVLFSDPNVYESTTPAHLRELKARADALGIEIQTGMMSICPSSVLFEAQRGSAEDQLEIMLHIAQSLGSSVLRCVLGDLRDRRSAGGIEARIVETVQVLQNVRHHALDCGVKIAVENHAGDMQSWELVTLIEEAGPDFVGATMDAGNAPWALEHPAESLEILGPYALSAAVRDTVVWEVEDGAVLQWTAMGEGNIDWPAYLQRFNIICPQTPIQIETVSGRPVPIPYWIEGFWDAYRIARIPEFMKFLALARKGKPRAAFVSGPGEEGARAERQFQLAELERSVRYCREVLGLGQKT